MTYLMVFMQCFCVVVFFLSDFLYERICRVCTRIIFSFPTISANLIFFVPLSLTLSQILSQILAIFRQRIILSEKRCSFIDSFNGSSRFKNQYSVKCGRSGGGGDLKLILTLIFKTSAVINELQCHELIISFVLHFECWRHKNRTLYMETKVLKSAV